MDNWIVPLVKHFCLSFMAQLGPVCQDDAYLCACTQTNTIVSLHTFSRTHICAALWKTDKKKHRKGRKNPQKYFPPKGNVVVFVPALVSQFARFTLLWGVTLSFSGFNSVAWLGLPPVQRRQKKNKQNIETEIEGSGILLSNDSQLNYGRTLSLAEWSEVVSLVRLLMADLIKTAGILLFVSPIADTGVHGQWLGPLFLSGDSEWASFARCHI